MLARTLSPTAISLAPITHSGVRVAAGVLFFAGLTAVGAMVRVPLPFTPVPMTLQTLSVLLAGIALGPNLGVCSQALYLLVGLCGVPVFAGVEAGPTFVFGSTAGYLAGFLLAPFVVGHLTSRQCATGRLFLATSVGMLTVFVLGVAWLAVILHSLEDALRLGLLPFLPAAAVKLALAGLIGRGVLSLTRRF